MSKLKIVSIQKTENYSKSEITNTLKKLSVLAEKCQRFGKDENNNIVYTNKGVAGAYYLDGKTIITNGFWGIAINELIEDLKMAQSENHFDLYNVIATSNIASEEWEKIFVDMRKLKQIIEENPSKTMKFGSLHFPVEQVYTIAKCIENKSIFVHKTELKPMIIKGTNGIGLVMPMKPEFVSK